jgi:hypothetical protein
MNIYYAQMWYLNFFFLLLLSLLLNVKINISCVRSEYMLCYAKHLVKLRINT